MDDDPDSPIPRFASRGRAIVYVLPCRDEDLLKVGFSRDPLQRLQTLHARFFRFFDLDRAFLIGTDYVRDARRIERQFLTALAERRAPARRSSFQTLRPATREWYRGAYADIVAMAQALRAAEGFVLYTPPRGWLHDLFPRTQRALLYAWSAKMLEAIEYERRLQPAAVAAAERVRARAARCAGLL